MTRAVASAVEQGRRDLGLRSVSAARMAEPARSFYHNHLVLAEVLGQLHTLLAALAIEDST